MNNQLLMKVINFGEKSSPPVVYENPLLDPKMTKLLARSFIKILNVSNENANMGNLRTCVLENVRRLCQSNSEGHKVIDENFIHLLSEFYNKDMADSESNESMERKLDMFLVRQFKDMEINSNFSSDLNPEVIQALLNLNQQGVYLEKLSDDLILWNTKSSKHMNVVQNMWNQGRDVTINFDIATLNDISIKMKSELEKILLTVAYNILTKFEPDYNEILAQEEVQNLINKCRLSADCFQITTGVLNFIFIHTNYDKRIQKFIPILIRKIQEELMDCMYITLYPRHMSGVVILLDMDLALLDGDIRNSYYETAMELLGHIHRLSEHDLILLLSHYPQWFEIYFNK